jgi:radical SAM superfamily enzyme YgiQ (UPF0313 family)
VDKSLYLINPAEKSAGIYSVEVLEGWGIGRAVHLADLATPTVAAMAPPDWRVAICDERIQPVDFETPAAVVGITGKVSQRDRMIRLAAEFRRRGKLVMIGGPYASLNPEDLRPHADILVRGEIEEIAGRIFADLAAGTWQADYQGTRPDLSTSPVPRWDLYPRGVALLAQVQTSRGCPFECEFCDVIQYLGRRQRWKEPDQVIRELDVLYAQGYRNIFLADDNFTVMRRRTHALLERLAAWNRSRPYGQVSFSTQVSVDLARDPELLAHCVEAGLRIVFVGIETPNEASLAETMKRQNLRVDLAAEVSKIVNAGIMVMCGMIVGFDHDGPDIFEIQEAFIARLPVPVVGLGLLGAPAATPLHARMKKEGRLKAHDRVGAGDLLDTNIVPKLMSEAQLTSGLRWLLNRIYTPAAYARRVERYVAASPPPRQAPRPPQFRSVEQALGSRLARYGAEEQTLLMLFERLVGQRPDLRGGLSYALLHYCQMRYVLEMHGIWDPVLARREMARAG